MKRSVITGNDDNGGSTMPTMNTLATRSKNGGSIMRSAAVRMKLARHGFFDHLEEFEKSQYWSEAELRAYQESKLQKLIKHSYETVPFYKEMFHERKLTPGDVKTIGDLHKLPVMNKETLRSNFTRLLSSNTIEKRLTVRTGGSTGVPLVLVNNSTSVVVESALYYRFLRWLGYDWGDPILLFWGRHEARSVVLKLRKALIRRLFNIKFYNTYDMSDQLHSEIIDMLQKAPPKVVRGYAAAIYSLACKALEQNKRLTLNAVTTTAEKLYEFQRSMIEEAFGKNVFDQYGCGETSSIAFECEKHQGLHVAAEHVVLEIVSDDAAPSKQGNVLITNLDNYAMPIIRYANGDQAIGASSSCSCGRNLPKLERIEGRVYDLIQGPNGKKIHVGFFDDIFLDLDVGRRYGVREFRVVQEEVNRIRIEFVTTTEISERDKSIIEGKVIQYLGNTEVAIRNVGSIPFTKMGKKMFVLSLLNRDKWQ